MFDANWELINGADAHEIEVLNQANQANVIEALVRFLTHHDQTPGAECAIPPGQEILLELHRTGTLLLLRQPGRYRTCDVLVRRRDGGEYHPPAFAAVPGLMEAFEAEMAAMWPNASAVQVAAYALWRINWVHPFKNGNGRTARAFAYACVNLKYGFMLPGSVTLIDLITSNRDEYEAALAHADQAIAAAGVADLDPMHAFVERLLRAQLESIPAGQG
jgi:Fic family protein